MTRKFENDASAARGRRREAFCRLAHGRKVKQRFRCNRQNTGENFSALAVNLLAPLFGKPRMPSHLSSLTRWPATGQSSTSTAASWRLVTRRPVNRRTDRFGGKNGVMVGLLLHLQQQTNPNQTVLKANSKVAVIYSPKVVSRYLSQEIPAIPRLYNVRAASGRGSGGPPDPLQRLNSRFLPQSELLIPLARIERSTSAHRCPPARTVERPSRGRCPRNGEGRQQEPGGPLLRGGPGTEANSAPALLRALAASGQIDRQR